LTKKELLSSFWVSKAPPIIQKMTLMRLKTVAVYTFSALAVQAVEREVLAIQIPENDTSSFESDYSLAEDSSTVDKSMDVAPPESLVDQLVTHYSSNNTDNSVLVLPKSKFAASRLKAIKLPAIAPPESEVNTSETANKKILRAIAEKRGSKEKISFGVGEEKEKSEKKPFLSSCIDLSCNKSNVLINLRDKMPAINKAEALLSSPASKVINLNSSSLERRDTQNTTPSNTSGVSEPSAAEIEDVKSQLEVLQKRANDNSYVTSPAMTIATPIGFGADNNRFYLITSSQFPERYSGEFDPALGVGVGLFNSRKTVGVELSYTFTSFGAQSREFGTGGYNIKVHRQFPGDLGIAVGWNGFATNGPVVDYKNTAYGVLTQIIRTKKSLDEPFSRVALSFGIGNGQFRSENDIARNLYDINAFGSIAVRVARPVSAVVEWTGQDLAAGLSIVPFRNSGFVITPSVRDITGTQSSPRFVLGAGFSFNL
jgi:hypothetical protein